MINEAPFLAMAALLASTLGVVARRGLQARPALRRALAASLGPDWCAHRPAAAAGRLMRPASVRDLVLQPLPVRGRAVQRLPDLANGDDAGRQTLDVYRRRGSDDAGPTLVFLHGGAFRGGDKHREGRALLHRFARHGWCCISASRALAPHVSYSEQVRDVKQVIAWARQVGPRGATPSGSARCRRIRGSWSLAFEVMSSLGSCRVRVSGRPRRYGRLIGRGRQR